MVVETLQRAFEPYRHLDPLGWVGVFRFLPPWAGGVSIVVGLLMLLFGGGRLFRVVAAPLGAAIGLIWVSAVASRLGVTAKGDTVALVAAAALALLGLLFPPAVVFFSFGMPIGLTAAQLVGPTDWLLAFVPAFIIGGALGIVLHRVVSSVLSAAVGAWVLLMGCLAVVNPWSSAAGTLAQSPIVVLVVAGCFAVAGAVYQLVIRGSPEENEKQKRERLLERQKQKEDRVLAKRWSSYSKKKRG